MRMRTRLRILEEQMTGLGCSECRHRSGTIFRTSRPLPDGSAVWDVDKPQPCPRCGRIPELIIEVIVPVMEEISGASEPDGWLESPGISV